MHHVVMVPDGGYNVTYFYDVLALISDGDHIVLLLD